MERNEASKGKPINVPYVHVTLFERKCASKIHAVPSRRDLIDAARYLSAVPNGLPHAQYQKELMYTAIYFAQNQWVDDFNTHMTASALRLIGLYVKEEFINDITLPNK